MRTNDLIMQLANDGKPVKSARAEIFLIVWFLLGGMFGGFFLWQMGLVAGIESKLQQWDYVLGLVFLLIAYVIATVMSIKSAQPGSGLASGRTDLVIGGIVLIALAFYAGIFSGNAVTSSPMMHALGCCLRISFGALLPNLAAAVIVSRLAPVDTRNIVKYAMTSSLLLISIVSQLNCPVTDVGHVIVGHGLMLIVTAAVTYFAYVAIFRLLANKALVRNLGALSVNLKAKIS